MSCPLCGNAGAKVWGLSAGREGISVECPRCGLFGMSGTMSSTTSGKSAKERFIVSTYTREHLLKNLPSPVIFTGSVTPLQIKASNKTFDIGWDTIVSQELPLSISEKIDRTLYNFSRMEQPSKWIKIRSEIDWVLAYAEDVDGWQFVTQQLQEDKLIEIDIVHSSIRVTPKGWNRVADIERGTAALPYKQAFVAMWFDGFMSQAWESGFKPGISDGTDIKAVRIDLKEHNEKICDVIISEIRKSSFLVADFTGNRGGVYFEAGFAKGLGLPVIFTCQKGKWEKKLHFDTRQYNHIIWESPEDLKVKLQNRIKATIPMGNQSEK